MMQRGPAEEAVSPFSWGTADNVKSWVFSGCSGFIPTKEIDRVD
jgi:hypothetical protein